MFKDRNFAEGLAAAITAYIAWGILPLYWKCLAAVPAHEILAHRIVWSFMFMVLIVAISGRFKQVGHDLKRLRNSPQKTACVLSGAFLICGNWLIYIWAVNAGRVLETSLGYYINPLGCVLLGLVFLKESLSPRRTIAILMAASGVIYLTLSFGSPPWVSLGLALSMGFYGLCKKVAGLSAITGMALETSITAPLAFIYLVIQHLTGSGFPLAPSSTLWLLIGTGFITVIPLLMFASSLNKLSLTYIGLLQYISPTITFFMGVFLFREPFTQPHFISFLIIWSALMLFSLPRRLKRPCV